MRSRYLLVALAAGEDVVSAATCSRVLVVRRELDDSLLRVDVLQSGCDSGRRLIHASSSTLGLLAALHPGAALLEGSVEGACVILTVRDRLVVMAT